MTNHKIKNQYLTPFRESINGLVATDQGLFIGDGGIMAKDAPRIEKPCEQCKNPMYCTAQRKICSKCRRENEKIGKRKIRNTV